MRMRVPRSASICLLTMAFILAAAGESNAQRLTPADCAPGLTVHAPGAGINAQSQFAPYYGKNQIHYDKFDWHIYKTDHFEIYYYPENEQHLASGRELRRKRVSAGQLGPAPRSRRARAAHHLQDAQRVPAAEHRARRRAGRRARVRRRRAAPHGAADRSAVGSALRADRARADARLPVQHHPDLAHPPQHAAVGARRRRRIRARHLGSARSDDGARRGCRRHHPAHEPDGGLRRFRQPAPGLQPRPRAVRVHRSAVEQRRGAAVPLLAAQERHRRRLEPVRRSVPDVGARIRSAVREISEGSLQGVPRQRAAGRLRTGSVARSRAIAVHGRDFDRAVAVGRPHRHGDRQPSRPGARHHSRVGERRRGRAQPDARLRHGSRVRVPRVPEPQQHGAVDVVVARWRPHRVLRAAGEIQDAHHPERADRQDRDSASTCRASTIPSRRTSRPMAARCSSAACAAAVGDLFRLDISSGDITNLTNDEFADYGPDLLARRPLRRLSGPHQRIAEAVPAGSRHRRRRRSSPSARRTRRRRSS